jgi:hypothetical protein
MSEEKVVLVSALKLLDGVLLKAKTGWAFQFQFVRLRVPNFAGLKTMFQPVPSEKGLINAFPLISF